MGSKPPTELISWVKSYAPGSTHVTHEAACIPSACVPPQELRTKHRFHMVFGIILKYFSQGLKPPRLNTYPLFPTFQPPISYPLCGSLVPHHSFIVVDLHAVVFIFLLMFYMITYTKEGSHP
jgi:hypothetical protein